MVDSFVSLGSPSFLRPMLSSSSPRPSLADLPRTHPPPSLHLTLPTSSPPSNSPLTPPTGFHPLQPFLPPSPTQNSPTSPSSTPPPSTPLPSPSPPPPLPFLLRNPTNLSPLHPPTPSSSLFVQPTLLLLPTTSPPQRNPPPSPSSPRRVDLCDLRLTNRRTRALLSLWRSRVSHEVYHEMAQGLQPREEGGEPRVGRRRREGRVGSFVRRRGGRCSPSRRAGKIVDRLPSTKRYWSSRGTLNYPSSAATSLPSSPLPSSLPVESTHPPPRFSLPSFIHPLLLSILPRNLNNHPPSLPNLSLPSRLPTPSLTSQLTLLEISRTKLRFRIGLDVEGVRQWRDDVEGEGWDAGWCAGGAARDGVVERGEKEDKRGRGLKKAERERGCCWFSRRFHQLDDNSPFRCRKI